MSSLKIVIGNAARAVMRLRSATSKKRQRRIALVIAAFVFLVGGAFAIARLEIDASSIRWNRFVLLVLTGVPLTAIGKALEYDLSARLLGHRPTFRDSMTISVMSTAANLLPIPGSFLVRTEALHRMGSARSRAAASTLSIALLWIGSASAISGVILTTRTSLGAVVFLAAGVVALLAAFFTGRRHSQDPRRRNRLLLAGTALEIALLSVAAYRLLLAIDALAIPIGWTQAFVLTLSGVLASAVGVFPGGLGLREGLAALLAPLVAIPSSAAYVGAAIDRVAGAVVHGFFAIVLARWLPADDGDVSVTNPEEEVNP